jgi:hypothetical protein
MIYTKMNNIPAGYDENGERAGNGLMDNDIEEAMENGEDLELTTRELVMIERALINESTQALMPPRDSEAFEIINSAYRKIDEKIKRRTNKDV